MDKTLLHSSSGFKKVDGIEWCGKGAIVNAHLDITDIERTPFISKENGELYVLLKREKYNWKICKIEDLETINSRCDLVDLSLYSDLENLLSRIDKSKYPSTHSNVVEAMKYVAKKIENVYSYMLSSCGEINYYGSLDNVVSNFKSWMKELYNEGQEGFADDFIFFKGITPLRVLKNELGATIFGGNIKVNAIVSASYGDEVHKYEFNEIIPSSVDPSSLESGWDDYCMQLKQETIQKCIDEIKCYLHRFENTKINDVLYLNKQGNIVQWNISIEKYEFEFLPFVLPSQRVIPSIV